VKFDLIGFVSFSEIIDQPFFICSRL